MDKLVERLPSPGGLALWLYALAFVILPALLAYAGFVYVIGIVIFAVGVRPHLDAVAAGEPLRFAYTWRKKRYIWNTHVPMPGKSWSVRIVSWVLLLLAILLLPAIVFALQSQGALFYAEFERRLPEILQGIDSFLAYAHDELPDYVPDVNLDAGSGWDGLSSALSQVAGEALKDINAVVQSVFTDLLGVIGGLLGDWVKLVIAALIVGTILSGWDKEVAMHRRVVSGGIKDQRLRANALRFGELFQTGVSLFMIGYLEVAATLSFLYIVSMLILPLGLGIGAILFMGIILGFVTAIPKIGGFLGMAVAALLMLMKLSPGLGWFGWTVVSFGTVMDVLIRAALLIAVAKLFGLLEAYSYTPEIVGKKLGMTKMQIIATILIWAVGAGFFGMIWGILLSLAFQAALRLAEETEQAEAREPTSKAAE